MTVAIAGRLLSRRAVLPTGLDFEELPDEHAYRVDTPAGSFRVSVADLRERRDLADYLRRRVGELYDQRNRYEAMAARELARDGGDS